MGIAGLVLIASAVMAGVVGLSYLFEALRPAPTMPNRLSWGPGIEIRSATIDGLKLRYVATGMGPSVLLLHTLRTQLDMFQRTVHALGQTFRVYAVDLPGHGYSDIPGSDLEPELFVRTIGGFLDELDLEDVVVVGESIGATIGLLLAARGHPRVKRVVAINPYDYDRGRGTRRASLGGNVVLALAGVPLIGGTVMRFRNPLVENATFLGGVRRRASFPPGLLAELTRAANRRGYTRAFHSLVRRWPAWEAARAEYGAIECPVLLLYGEYDWSRPSEREANRKAISGARFHTVEDAGHFLSLDAPDEVVAAVREFALTGPRVS